ncbi:alpha/beta fold hydrolase [Beijerinckia sp. L45]|uniref:alpha/beta fold hydrolase n=1 Tax=Beijerinckia sp. L45 TaxID=1641855 RepID=UPI00131CC15B|nr:alpha/beta hydrolase [Beijerinckia sp. L45]
MQESSYSNGLLAGQTYRSISVDGVRTSYLEAGLAHKAAKPTVLLLHSGEFGGCAESSWNKNILSLAQDRHVLAPDLLGFGDTDKIFDFSGQFDRRIQHLRRFIEIMDVSAVHLIGSSMSGGLSLAVAAREKPDWPIVSVLCCSGAGAAPDNEARAVLNSYDGSLEHMRLIVRAMFYDPAWADDEVFVRRRWEWSRRPGAWEATAAARFKPPFLIGVPAKRERDSINYSLIKVPVLLCVGRHDQLRVPGYTDAFLPEIPNGRLHTFENAGHLANIECHDEFNQVAGKFLNSVDDAA